MTTARRLHHSYQQYLELLARSDFKLEFCDGAIYAMAGGTVAHAALGAACVRVLGQGLLGRCTVFTSDLRIRIEASDLSTFPDVAVVCGSPETSAIDVHAVTNPRLVVEVTSRPTEDYDRGDKLSHYKQLPSLQAVLFVSHRAARITVVERREGAGTSETCAPARWSPCRLRRSRSRSTTSTRESSWIGIEVPPPRHHPRPAGRTSPRSTMARPRINTKGRSSKVRPP